MLNRLLIVLVAALAMALQGCADAARAELRPWVATSGMLALMSPSPAPLPPAPTPGAKCGNCRGTGIVGDKKTGIRCPECGGTGVVPVSSVGEAARSAAPGATFRIVCEDGVCRRITIAPTSR